MPPASTRRHNIPPSISVRSSSVPRSSFSHGSLKRPQSGAVCSTALWGFHVSTILEYICTESDASDTLGTCESHGVRPGLGRGVSGGGMRECASRRQPVLIGLRLDAKGSGAPARGARLEASIRSAHTTGQARTRRSKRCAALVK